MTFRLVCFAFDVQILVCNIDVQINLIPQYVTGHIGEKIEDEKGNMMWLVDFKLDFLNDIEKSGGEKDSFLRVW